MIKFLVLGLLAFTSPVSAEGMKFKISPDTLESNVARLVISNGKQEIFASGEIDSGATERFLKFIQEKSIENAIVLFDSPGGSLAEGINLGKAIRAMQFDTAVGSYGPNGRRAFQGMCASSCAYAYAGGTHRFYYGDKERLGIHQFYSSDNNQGDIGDAQLVSSVLIDYLQAMGVDPKAFVLASTARGDAMVWLTTDNAISLGLSNNGSVPTSAEIKMTGLHPYLKIEQNHHNVTARVLFNCITGKVTIDAGIVTTPEMSSLKRSFLTRTYFETETGELLEQRGDTGTTVVDSVLWLERTLKNSDLVSLIKANELGIWTENDGPMRWGATIDLRPAREKILYFAKNCVQPR